MKVLARKFNSVDMEKKEVSVRNEKLMTEFLQMESVLRTRITELIECKDRAEGRSASMEALTKTWVPREELLKLSYEHQMLRDKYAVLISEKAESQIRSAEYREALAHVSQMTEEMQTLRQEHKAALDQSDKMQRTLDTVARVAQADDDENASDYQRMKKLTQKLMGQLSGLQAKYESASLRAKRAQELKVLAETTTAQVQQDIEGIETKLGAANHKYQAEHELLMDMEQKLTGSVPYSKAIVLHKQLDDLRQETSDLRAEVKKYRYAYPVCMCVCLCLCNIYVCACYASVIVLSSDSIFTTGLTRSWRSCRPKRPSSR
jgi:myosin heavy subunit